MSSRLIFGGVDFALEGSPIELELEPRAQILCLIKIKFRNQKFKTILKFRTRPVVFTEFTRLSLLNLEPH